MTMKEAPGPHGQHYDLLIELGTEELPPRTLQRLSRGFANGIAEALRNHAIETGDVSAYASPRRLAVLARQVADRQPDGVVERRGPALVAAFGDNGEPTPAALGFARSCGIAVEALGELRTDKGAWLVFRKSQPGRLLKELLPELLSRVVAGLPVARRMRWANLRDEFVRPVHWLVVLYADEPVKVSLFGVDSGRETFGHRFHHPAAITIAHASTYAPLLESEGHVMADFNARRQAILGQISEVTMEIGGEPVVEEDLLDEVTGLVEWPSTILGEFDRRFLEVPQEAIIAALRDHQKCFHVIDDDGRLLPYFIAVSNIESRQPELVRQGFQRVIRPRLADADFFWRQDRRQKLEDLLPRLKHLVFQHQIGSMHDKVERMSRLAVFIAELSGADSQAARQAALLSKCDLLTRMVGEFPELQGVMGRYYALHEGLPESVANALGEHYMPRYSGDDVPATITGQVVAMADKIDTLTAIFSIGQVPTGDRDPFALRRHALGTLRILIEKKLKLDLLQMIRKACEQLDDKKTGDNVAETVFDFMYDRLKAYYLDSGTRTVVFDAVAARRPTSPYDFHLRIKAVEAFCELPAAASLAAANKRVHNILRQADFPVAKDFDTDAMTEAAERKLAQEVVSLRDGVNPLIEAGAYQEALMRLADLRDDVDAFFDQVLVMSDDEATRGNRLALLQQMHTLFLQIADISRL